MRLESVFSIFSRREQREKTAVRPLATEFRNRVFMLCKDTFSGSSDEFWSDMCRNLRYVHGRMPLTKTTPLSDAEEAITFLCQCGDEHFLDFVEMIFQFEWLWKVCPNEDTLVDDVNRLFEADNLPYALTGFVRESGKSYLFGTETTAIRITGYPQVIRRESQVEHAMGIKPVLTLLSNTTFASANSEFLDALADYRKGDYRDCLVKCGSAFESVMKITCDRKKWPYQQTHTASQLLNTILQNSSLDPYFEQPLMIIATLRNRVSTAHGAGTQRKDVPKHFARYAINATAAAILLIVDETTP